MQKVLFGLHMGKFKITKLLITTRIGVSQKMFYWKMLTVCVLKNNVPLNTANTVILN